MSETIAYYYDPKTGKYARKTKKNSVWEALNSTFNWRPIEKLLPRHQVKLSVLGIAENNIRIPGVGRWRKSVRNKHLLLFFLYHESWKKDFTYYPE